MEKQILQSNYHKLQLNLQGESNSDPDKRTAVFVSHPPFRSCKIFSRVEKHRGNPGDPRKKFGNLPAYNLQDLRYTNGVDLKHWHIISSKVGLYIRYYSIRTARAAHWQNAMLMLTFSANVQVKSLFCSQIPRPHFFQVSWDVDHLLIVRGLNVTISDVL